MLPPSWKTEIEETVEKATKLEGERQKTANDENAADIAAAIQAFSNTYNAQQSKPEKTDKVKRAIDIATIVLLFVTALFTGLAWWVFKAQLHEMEKAYKPLKDSADSAKAALIYGQRAWVRIDRISVGGGGMSITEDSVSVPIAFVVTNIGNAPAIKLSHHVKLVAMATGTSVTEEQDKTCDEVKSQRWESGFTLFPNDQFPRAMGVGEYAYGAGLSKEQIERGLEASKDKKHLALVIVGCIDYTFSTDPDTHHQTPFIRTVSKNEPSLISIDDKLIPPANLVLIEFGIGVGRPAN